MSKRATAGAGGRKTLTDVDLGGPPRMATVQDLAGANAPASGRHMAKRSSRKGEKAQLTANPNAKVVPKINLKAVAEACIDEGLDPATEIAKALNAKVPVFKDGRQVFDDNGLPVMAHLVDPDTRLRTLNSLLEYTQPKLKSVEVKMSGALELTSEQLDQRLGALMAKAGM